MAIINASVMEVLKRRFQHEEWEEPDLLVIDGGKGQLNAAVKVLQELGKTYVPVVGLAKERTKSNFQGEIVDKTFERFYLRGRQNPVTFAEASEAYKILIGLRDEAHRFAISFHRKLREDQTLKSQLDSIKGLGPKLKKRLLESYESVEAIRQTSVSELSSVEGISKKLAETILQSLAPEKE